MYYDWPQKSVLDTEYFRPQHQLGLGDFLSRTMSNTFERNTTLGIASEESRIRDAEDAAGVYYGMAPDTEGGIGSMPDAPLQHPFAMSKDEWEQSAHYRKGIDYTPHMSEPRAQIYAEIFDRREHEKQLLSQSNTGFIRPVLGFGAALLASLPDPINFIPVVGAASRGASIGAKVARGALEGAASNIAADAVLFPVANKRGEDFGLYDVAMDAVFGAVIGGGIGGIGGLLQKRGTDRFLRDTANEQGALTKALAETGMDEKAANSATRDIFTELYHSAGRSEVVERMRGMVGGEERQQYGLLFDSVVQGLEKDKPPNIAQAVEKLQLNEGAQRVLDDIHAKRLEEDPFSVLAMLRPEDLEPMIVNYGTGVVVDGQVQVKGREVKAVHGSSGGFGLIKVIVRHGEESGRIDYVTRTDILNLPRIVRDFSPIEDAGHQGRTWVVGREDGRQLVVGEKVTDEGRVLATMYIRDADKSPLPFSEKRKSPAESTQERFSALVEDTSGGLEVRPDHGQQGVNAADALETPDTHAQKMPEDVNTVNSNIEGKASPESYELDRLRREGLVKEEDLIALRDHDAIAQRTERLREDALSIVTCISGVAA